MPARVAEIIREGVIQSWLGGSSFREIAIKHDISEGSVCNIIAEKKNQHGSDQLDFYRDLGVAMYKSGLTVHQGADGHRTAMILRNLGVDEAAFEGFISRLWKHYVNAGLGPENLTKQIDELHYFLERNQNLNGSASIPQICEKLNVKQAQEKRLQNEITDLESKKYDSQKELTEIRSQKLYVEAELGLTTEIKEKLEANRLQIDDIPRCIDLVARVKECGYSLDEITERFSTMVGLEDSLVNLRIQETEEGTRNDRLVQENTKLNEVNSRYSQRLRDLVFLEEMGFGLPEFKQLHCILHEITEACGLPTKENAAVKWFFEHLQDRYYDYLDLEKAVQERRSEIANLKTQRDHQLLALNVTPDVGKVVDSLLRTRIKRGDIEAILKLIEQNRLSHAETLPVNNNSSSSLSSNSKPGSSDSNSEQDRENSRNPRSAKEIAENCSAGKVVENGDVALSDLDPQAFRDGSQNGYLLAEDTFSSSCKYLKQEGKQGGREEEKPSRFQSADFTSSNQKQDIENGEEAGPQSGQKEHLENDIIGFLQSFINPSPSDNSAPKDSERAKYDSVECPDDCKIIEEYAAKAASAKYDLASRLNPANKLHAGKEHRNLKAKSQHLPIAPPSPPSPKRIRPGVFAKTHSRIEKTQANKIANDFGNGP